jgi:hypothetical protein
LIDGDYNRDRDRERGRDGRERERRDKDQGRHRSRDRGERDREDGEYCRRRDGGSVSPGGRGEDGGGEEAKQKKEKKEKPEGKNVPDPNDQEIIEMNKLRARNEQAPGPTRTETTEVVIPLCNVFLKFCLETWVVQTRNVTFLLALSAACNYFDVSMCILLFFVIFR